MNLSIGELPGNRERVWYIISEESHQGPFSFLELEERRLAASTKIWAKGWPVPLAFEVLAMAYHPSQSAEPPPIPMMAAVSPRPAPASDPVEEEIELTPPLPALGSKAHWPKLVGVVVVAFGAGALFWSTRAPQLQRPEGLPLPAFREIREDFQARKAAGPVKAIGVSGDYRRLWLADSSRQDCSFDLTLTSNEDDNLSGEAVSLQSEGRSKQHWAMFEKWSFHAGQKLWPGRYLATLNRVDCKPHLPWASGERDLAMTFPVDVYAGPQRDLLANLASLRKLKRKRASQARQALVMSWRDVEEKCRTLSAISVQIQQNFSELLDQKVPWRRRTANTIQRYTHRFGGFLTNFTVRNEEDFIRIGRQEVMDKVKLMERGPVITNYAKRIGFLSMEVIEWLQKGVPKREQLVKRLQDYNASLETVRTELEAEAASAQAVYAAGTSPE